MIFDKLKIIVTIVLGILSIGAAVWGGFEYSQQFVKKEVFKEKHAELHSAIISQGRKIDIEILNSQIRWMQIEWKCYDLVQCKISMPPPVYIQYEELLRLRDNIYRKLGD
jgi:hypothetical protein